MLKMDREPREPRCYDLSEAAEFLEYDKATVAYWLRMGHLSGVWDVRAERWRIQPDDLLEFLRAAREPFPTGALTRAARPRQAFTLRASALPLAEELTD